MNLYLDLHRKQEKEVNEFLHKYTFFAFSDQQFKDGLKKFDIPEDQAKDRLYSIGGGGYILQERSKEYKELYERLYQERQNAQKDPETGRKYIYQMFRYELANHEYPYYGEVEETLEELAIDPEDLEKDPILKEELARAVADLEREAAERDDTEGEF